MYFVQKRSRGRFHSVMAIGRNSQAFVHWSGHGWPDWDSKKTVEQNVKAMGASFDLILAYKPLGDEKYSIPKMAGIEDVSIPLCIRYNEMIDYDWTVKEIKESGASLVICHHLNEMLCYQETAAEMEHGKIHYANISHCADPRFFKDYRQNRSLDVQLIGACRTVDNGVSRYPLRQRIKKLIPKLKQKGLKVAVWKNPSSMDANAVSDKLTINFARALNRAKINVTCSGTPRTRYAKYVEVPMCNSVLAADLPDEDQKFFKEFIIELSMDMSDKQLIKTLTNHLLEPDKLKKLRKNGRKLAKRFTQDAYAKHFIKIARGFLKAK